MEVIIIMDTTDIGKSFRYIGGKITLFNVIVVVENQITRMKLLLFFMILVGTIMGIITMATTKHTVVQGTQSGNPVTQWLPLKSLILIMKNWEKEMEHVQYQGKHC